MVGVWSPVGVGIFLSATPKPVLWLTQTPVRWIPGPLHWRVEGPELDADYSLLTNPEVTNTFSLAIPSIHHTLWCLIARTDDFPFDLFLYIHFLLLLYPLCTMFESIKLRYRPLAVLQVKTGRSHFLKASLINGGTFSRSLRFISVEKHWW
jgi:hypothetical protein